ncbi:MAG: VCBS repeat-containing protein [Planctomycetes bacterium]|nr:VCBS repeat-containing protein [Planctomycetota bacterium]
MKLALRYPRIRLVVQGFVGCSVLCADVDALQASGIFLADPIRFPATSNSPVGPVVFTGTVVADFTGDALPDVLTAAAWGGPSTSLPQLSLRTGDGFGGFSGVVASVLATAGGVVPNALAVADFDQDGNQDVAVSLPASGYWPVVVARNTGTGDFVPWANGGFDWPVSLAAGDVDSDGDFDIVSTFGSSTPSIMTLINNGAGTMWFPSCMPIWGQPWVIASPPEQVVDSELRDLDGDNTLDYVGSGNIFQIWEGFGQGCFQNGTPNPYWWTSGPPFIGGKKSFAIGDLSGDGAEDIVLAGLGGGAAAIDVAVYIRASSPTNSWNLGSTFVIQGTAMGAAASDFDTDGDLDFVLAVFSPSGSRMTTFENLGGGTTFTVNEFVEGYTGFPNHIRVTDLNGDGYPDLVVEQMAMSPNEISGFDVIMNAGSFSDLELIGLPAIDRTVHLHLGGTPGLLWALFASPATGPPIPLPGFQGTFQLDPGSSILAASGTFPSDGTTLLPVAIPNQPGLVNATVYLQHVSVDVAPGVGYFSTLRSVVIQ